MSTPLPFLFKYFLCYALTCLSCMTLAAQFDSDTLFSRAEVIEDIELIQTVLLEAHPAVEEYIGRDSLKQLFKHFIRQLPDSLNRIDFIRRVSPLIKTIRCGHTNLTFPILSFWEQIKAARGKLPNTRKYLPIELVGHEREVKIVQRNTLFQQKEIGTLLQLGAFRAQDILTILPAYLNRDGYTPVEDYYYRYYLTQYFNNILLDWEADSIDVLIEKEGKPTALRFANVKRPIRTIGRSLSNTWRKVSTVNNEWVSLNDPALFYSDSIPHTALLKISIFRGKRAAKVLKKIFKRLQKDKIEHLIIDLQGNSGGSIRTCTDLLRYTLQDSCSYHLVRKLYATPSFKEHIAVGKVAFKAKGERSLLKKMRKNSQVCKNKEEISVSIFPKTKHQFKGKIYVLVDGGTYSAATMASAFLQDKERATIIGQETAGTRDQFSAITTPLIQLPNTACTLRIPLYQAKLQLETPHFGRGVQADIRVQPSLEGILQQRDLALEQAMKLIKQVQNEYDRRIKN